MEDVPTYQPTNDMYKATCPSFFEGEINIKRIIFYINKCCKYTEKDIGHDLPNICIRQHRHVFLFIIRFRFLSGK